VDSSDFELRQVGSARHNYHKSDWYVRAKRSKESFRSDPYHYYDGTNISGYYTTFVKPVYDKSGRLACVCGADMTFEWLTKELRQIDYTSKQNEQLNKYLLEREPDFYTVVMNNDGTCIAHPEGKGLLLKDNQVINVLKQHKSGTVEMIVGGKPVTVYYGPIKNIDWSVAVVVPAQDIPQPVILAGLMLLVVAVLGMILIFKLVTI
jgi:hypothetical protein